MTTAAGSASPSPTPGLKLLGVERDEPGGKAGAGKKKAPAAARIGRQPRRAARQHQGGAAARPAERAGEGATVADLTKRSAGRPIPSGPPSPACASAATTSSATRAMTA